MNTVKLRKAGLKHICIYIYNSSKLRKIKLKSILLVKCINKPYIKIENKPRFIGNLLPFVFSSTQAFTVFKIYVAIHARGGFSQVNNRCETYLLHIPPLAGGIVLDVIVGHIVAIQIELVRLAGIGHVIGLGGRFGAVEYHIPLCDLCCNAE